MAANTMYQIREFLPENPVEIERMNLMYFHPAVMEAKGYASQDPDYAKMVDLRKYKPEMFATGTSISQKVEDVAYAIADQDNHLIGWIWFYIDNRHPLPKKVADKLGLNNGNARTYQLSYEKLMSEGWPTDLLDKLHHVKKEHLTIPRKGVVVEGLKLAINRLSDDYLKICPPPSKLALYGFVHPDNIASRKVLEANSFSKIEKMYRYDGVPHELWVRII